MKRVSLNHVLMKREVNLIAATLLLAGILVSIATLFHSQQLTQKIKRLQSDIELLKPITKTFARNLRTTQQSNSNQLDEAAIVNSAIRQIALPWPALFKTLESTNQEGIKLLVLEPNVQQQSLRVVGVAMDVDSMMRYMNELNQQKTLKNVILLSQESIEVNQQKAIEFVVEATWKI